ncbi:hypothetical protein LJR034_009307 [Caballeronia sp. LjRoot34]|uniref:hypothetical protein n=1 Tax=Caballeronia sp. LjRoot34 TaxID=3342325 RepID=UPI003ECD766B
MSYKGNFKDIYFPGVDRQLSVARYRIVVAWDHANPIPQAILQLVQLDADPEETINFLSALDVMLNKIVSTDLAGVRIDHMRLVVESLGASVEVPFDFSTEDFVHRGNPVVITGTGKFASVHIEANDVIGGLAVLFAHFENREPLNQFVAAALT